MDSIPSINNHRDGICINDFQNIGFKCRNEVIIMLTYGKFQKFVRAKVKGECLISAEDVVYGQYSKTTSFDNDYVGLTSVMCCIMDLIIVVEDLETVPLGVQYHSNHNFNFDIMIFVKTSDINKIKANTEKGLSDHFDECIDFIRASSPNVQVKRLEE